MGSIRRELLWLFKTEGGRGELLGGEHKEIEREKGRGSGERVEGLPSACPPSFSSSPTTPSSDVDS